MKTPKQGKQVLPQRARHTAVGERRTSRRWDPNIQRKRYFVPSEGRYITLRVSTKGISTIDRYGIESVLRTMRARGEKI
ncbi:large ribosomal subunit protein bL28 [Gordonia amicalis]